MRSFHLDKKSEGEPTVILKTKKSPAFIRYFKQIAKSVRSNGSASSGSEENADDFLGCINVPLNVSLIK